MGLVPITLYETYKKIWNLFAIEIAKIRFIRIGQKIGVMILVIHEENRITWSLLFLIVLESISKKLL